ncbi:MAG TPA: MFS transporter [Caulobacteraceae bacterium]|nr:MFS transporter [Caulobacteraceae bacterium]
MSVTAPADPPIDGERPILDPSLAPPADNHAARSTKLGFGALGVYGAGALVENITTLIVGQLLLFYLTIVCGLSGTGAGIALGLTLVVDAIVDPVVGSISDNSRSRHGRRHPFMFASILPIVVALGLLFSVPAGLSGLGLFAYATVTLFALRISISLFQVPYFALGAELSDDYAERSTIVAARVLFTIIGQVVFPILAFVVFLAGPHGRWNHAAYSPLAWSCAAIAATAALIAAIGTLGERRRLHTAASGASFTPGQFVREALEVLRNRSFRSLFFCCLVLFAGLGFAGALTLHANTFFWKLSSQALTTIGLVAPIGWLSGIFIAALLARGMEKRNIAMLGLALIGVAQVAPVPLRLANLIGLDQALGTLIAATILGGFGGALSTISFQSMMADAADEHEHLFAARREGLYFAGITFSAKAASGLGLLIGGIALDLIGFPHGPAATAAAIPAATVMRLGVTYGPGAALFTAVSVAVLIGFRLTRSEHARILADLKARRAGG